MNKSSILPIFILFSACSINSYDDCSSDLSIEIAEVYVRNFHPEKIDFLKNKSIVMDFGNYWAVSFVATEMIAGGGAPEVHISKESCKVIDYYLSQ